MNQLVLQHRNWSSARDRLWGGNGARPTLLGMPAPVDLLAKPTWRTILALVCLRRQVSFREVLSPNRNYEVTAARQEAMRLIYSHCHMSTTEIGHKFGRDHSTVVHAIHKGSPGWKTRKPVNPNSQKKGVAGDKSWCSMEDRHSNSEAVD